MIFDESSVLFDGSREDDWSGGNWIESLLDRLYLSIFLDSNFLNIPIRLRQDVSELTLITVLSRRGLALVLYPRVIDC